MSQYNTSLDPQTIKLIETQVETNNIQNLLTLYEALLNQRNRAELLNQSYLHEIKVLSDRFHSMTKPLERPERAQRAEGEGARERPPENRKQTKPTTSAIEIEL